MSGDMSRNVFFGLQNAECLAGAPHSFDARGGWFPRQCEICLPCKRGARRRATVRSTDGESHTCSFCFLGHGKAGSYLASMQVVGMSCNWFDRHAGAHETSIHQAIMAMMSFEEERRPRLDSVIEILEGMHRKVVRIHPSSRSGAVIESGGASMCGTKRAYVRTYIHAPCRGMCVRTYTGIVRAHPSRDRSQCRAGSATAPWRHPCRKRRRGWTSRWRRLHQCSASLPYACRRRHKTCPG
jgi:hypothetical protein